MAVSHVGRENLDRRSGDDHRGPIGGQDRTEELDQLVSYAGVRSAGRPVPRVGGDLSRFRKVRPQNVIGTDFSPR